MFHRSRGRRRSRSGGGKGQAIVMLVAIVFALLAPILARLLYFACSRRREYLADASAARFTRYPAGLASALEKISRNARPLDVNRAAAPMFTVNPSAAAGGGGWFGTHPPTDDRIRVLRSMGGSAGYAAYEQAYRSALGGSGLLGGHTLAQAEAVQAREGTPDEREPLERAREALDTLHRAAGMLMFHCACGLKMKIPESYEGDSVECPRCHRDSPIPRAAALGTLAAAGLADTAQKAKPEPASAPSIEHTPGEWTSARCECGGTVQLSPSFSAQRASCRVCGRHYQVEHSSE
jgi:heat shock protein HtpX